MPRMANGPIHRSKPSPSCTQYGSTPLILASAEGHLEIVKTLVASGADVNAKSIVGDGGGRGDNLDQGCDDGRVYREGGMYCPGSVDPRGTCVDRRTTDGFSAPSIHRMGGGQNASCDQGDIGLDTFLIHHTSSFLVPDFPHLVHFFSPCICARKCEPFDLSTRLWDPALRLSLTPLINLTFLSPFSITPPHFPPLLA